MPTESAFLLAGLLFVAAALGYVFAKFGDTDGESEPPPPGDLSANYLRGVNFLLNEESDRALEVFARMAEVDGDALETHFALGTLFRKRGEVERAIRIHQNIMARPGLPRAQQAQARFALAEDYLSAGLLDRAEALYEELRDAPEFGVRALRRLMRVYEVTRDWSRAVEVHEDLQRREPQAEGLGQVGHYYCELAEQARAERDPVRARDFLKRAEAARVKTVRSDLVRAGLADDAGDWREAQRLYTAVAEQAPHLLAEIVPRVARALAAAGDPDALGGFLDALLARHPSAVAPVAMAVIRDPAIDHPRALAILAEFIGSNPELADLVDASRLESLPEVERLAALRRLQGVLGRMGRGAPAYRCTNCGYASLTMQWQCPGCRSWESMRPEQRLAVTAGG